jgi:predicted transcriptional regulator
MEKLFEAIGLNANEREVYLAVLSAGKISPQRVARLTGINRTTVYSIARKLRDSGFISEDVGQKVTYLLAESPENLKDIFEREEKKLSARKAAALELAKELSTLPRNANYSVPRIKFIEEADLSAYLYAEYNRWQESAKSYDDTWWGFQDNTFTEKYDAWIDWCWKQTPEVKTRLFLNDVQIEQQMGKKYTERNARPLPSGVHFDSSFWVVGDYLLMAQTRERPHYLVEIHDTVLARNQRALFKGLWDSVK